MIFANHYILNRYEEARVWKKLEEKERQEEKERREEIIEGCWLRLSESKQDGQ